jgi:hypothetical protein
MHSDAFQALSGHTPRHIVEVLRSGERAVNAIVEEQRI